ncbi:choice-of-anchor Q domain-containing protein, partial [Xanthomonas citri pv. citri]
YNVDSLHQCIPTPAAGDRKDLDPQLGPLQDNGGPTTTMAPLAGSPLIDGGPATCTDTGGAPLTADQRGADRGTPCDNGASEAIAPTATAAPAIAGNAPPGETLTCQPAVFAGDGPQTIETVWLRDGQQAATGTQYAIPAADVGHAIACRMT